MTKHGANDLPGPTDAEYAAYDGMHCRTLWRLTPDHWRCPCCDRTKRQIMRWGTRTGSNARRYGPAGWKCGLHQHHDHGGENGGIARFPETLICGGCNTAEGQAKRTCRMPTEFSFSPAEIRQFVTATANGPVRIDLAVATRIAKLHRTLEKCPA